MNPKFNTARKDWGEEAIVAIDEDVAAVEVAVDDAGVVDVEVVEPLEDLSRQLLERLDEDMMVALPVLAAGRPNRTIGSTASNASSSP
jgi:hypothetical protein